VLYFSLPYLCYHLETKNFAYFLISLLHRWNFNFHSSKVRTSIDCCVGWSKWPLFLSHWYCFRFFQRLVVPFFLLYQWNAALRKCSGMKTLCTVNLFNCLVIRVWFFVPWVLLHRMFLLEFFLFPYYVLISWINPIRFENCCPSRGLEIVFRTCRILPGVSQLNVIISLNSKTRTLPVRRLTISFRRAQLPFDFGEF